MNKSLSIQCKSASKLEGRYLRIFVENIMVSWFMKKVILTIGIIILFVGAFVFYNKPLFP